MAYIDACLQMTNAKCKAIYAIYSYYTIYFTNKNNQVSIGMGLNWTMQLL